MQLAGVLADSEQVRACVLKQWLRYGLGRKESAADDHALQTTYEAFKGSDYDLRELLVALVTSRAFTHRTLSPDEIVEELSP